MTNQYASLTDAQIDILAELMETKAIPNMGMNLEALDGFLTAVVLSPEPIPFEEWEPVVWGDGDPNLTASERSQGQELLQIHHQSVTQRVELDSDEIPEELTPLMWLPQEVDFENAQIDELEVGADWARGFFTGVGLRESRWDEWLDEEDFLEEILTYLDQLESGEIMNPEDPTAPGEPVAFKERMEIIAALPTMMKDIAHKQRLAKAAQVLQ